MAKRSGLAPTAARDAAGRPVKRLQAERPERWTMAKETRFFTELALTANIRHSLRAVGMSAASLYHRRRTRADFAAAWDAALDEGYAFLEALSLSRTLNEAPLDGRAPDPALRPVTDAVMLALLKAHAARVGAYRAARSAAPDSLRLRRDMTERFDRLARQVAHDGDA